MVLAIASRMAKPQLMTASLGAALGALLLRERRERIRAERLGAATLETLLDAIEANDAVTGAHVRRVARYSLILAEAAELDERTYHSIERVALFHDIGKLDEALSDIFHDASKLDPGEWRAVRTHPRRGEEVLAPLSCFYPDLGKGVAAHHERWDGKGYPNRLRGKKIPITARVVAIADTFDAVTHRRRYSAARSLREAVEVISAGRGTQFDPELTDLFLSTPVIEHIDRAMREAHAPRKKSANRRHPGTQSAPDITFRWRTGSSKRPPQGRSKKKSRS